MEGEGTKKIRSVTIHKSEVSTENTKKAVDLVQEAMDKFQIEKVRLFFCSKHLHLCAIVTIFSFSLCMCTY